LSLIVTSARNLLDSARTHIALTGTPGYDPKLGVHNLVFKAAKIMQALQGLSANDFEFEADNFLGVLRENAMLLATHPEDRDALTAVERATMALGGIRAERDQEHRPAGPPNGSPEGKADPLDATLEKIARGSLATSLVRYLAARTNRSGSLRDLCVHIYKSKSKKCMRNASRLVNRTTELLEVRSAPFRIVRDQQGISLIECRSDQATS
jgi:hypothetical protein